MKACGSGVCLTFIFSVVRRRTTYELLTCGGWFISVYAAQFDASRRGKEALNSARDKSEGAYRSGEGGEEPPLSDPGPELGLRRGKEKTKARRYQQKKEKTMISTTTH